ncbi:MAG: hypothetical protein ACOC35_10595, partial [Promethearchaeia archaeon]
TLLEKNNSQRKTESKTESESKRKPRPHRDLPPASDFTAFKQHTREIMRDVGLLCERLRKRREG